jgi:hypothetical protein
VKENAAGCLILVLAFAGALAFGFLVGHVLALITGNEKLPSAAATAVWILSFCVLLQYGSLWARCPRWLRERSTPTSPREARREGKLPTAECRWGFVFAVVGGALSSVAEASSAIVAAVAVVCGLIGVWLGHDFKRRVKKCREQHASQTCAAESSGTEELR